MLKIGRIRDIWRYPVKGMAGERIDFCKLDKRGLMGDRRWALRDEARQEVQSCKTRPQLLQCQARFLALESTDESAAVRISFADGTIVDVSNPDIHARLSAVVGRPSTLQAIRPALDTAFYRRYKFDDSTWLRELEATFERHDGEALPNLDNLSQVQADYVSVPGSLFLSTPFHLITTATLSNLRKLNPVADWDTRRFRPNVVIETESQFEGFVEQDWKGKHLAIGSAILTIVGPTVRCGAVTREQAGLAFDAGTLRTIIRAAAQNAGVYGEIEQAGLLRTGDDVVILDS
jgi:uncharacterized protein YcbX